MEHGPELAHLGGAGAGAGLLVAPSMFERCGLAPLTGMRYGTVRAVGGVAGTLAIESVLSRTLGQWSG